MKWLPIALMVALFSFGCSDGLVDTGSNDALQTESVSAAADLGDAAAKGNSNACWGQATKVFAQMGDMGTHSSSQTTPRLGLRNLARYLFDQGVIADDTMEALGQFVASELGLSIDACM